MCTRYAFNTEINRVTYATGWSLMTHCIYAITILPIPRLLLFHVKMHIPHQYCSVKYAHNIEKSKAYFSAGSAPVVFINLGSWVILKSWGDIGMAANSDNSNQCDVAGSKDEPHVDAAPHPPRYLAEGIHVKSIFYTTNNVQNINSTLKMHA